MMDLNASTGPVLSDANVSTSATRVVKPAVAARSDSLQERSRPSELAAVTSSRAGWDPIVVASMESFPASDPPAWIGARARTTGPG